MNRYSSKYQYDMALKSTASAATISIVTEPLRPGELPPFGITAFTSFGSNGTFKVPANVTRLRVRVYGASGAGSTPGTPGTAGGTTSFGPYISATGGAGGNGATGGAGGTGAGGEFQSAGGKGGDGFANGSGGAGGAGGSIGGDGGAGENGLTNGDDAQPARGGPVSAMRMAGFRVGGTGAGSITWDAYAAIYERFIPRFTGEWYSTMSFDGSGNAAQSPFAGYGAAGQGAQTLFPSMGGGGKGGVNYADTGDMSRRKGQQGAGPGGGGGGSGQGGAGGGGGGFAWGFVDVTPGQEIPVTVGAPGAGNAGANDYSSGHGTAGLVVVEW